MVAGNMEDYYRKRAFEYEEVCHSDNPRRVAELKEISGALQKRLQPSPSNLSRGEELVLRGK